MNQKQRNRITSFTALALNLAFMLMMASKSLFIHTHYTSDGRMVLHAHPFQKNNENKPFHNHAKASFDFWKAAEQLIDAQPIAIEIGTKSFSTFEFLQQNFGISKVTSTIQTGRAPPPPVIAPALNLF